MPEFIVALTTCPKKKSENLARSIVEERVCACVNIISSVKSVYHWKDEIITDEESLLIIKTQEDLTELLWESIKKLHPYEVPEFVILPIKWGSTDYLNWISQSIKTSS
ncbi:divalent-cation tolerance protein CutA [Candidatus Thorarchaeota archaeon]|nr:MAG: divalent-cation tolerance protein CutA [Candidatus Thorarchaeota archaeon]